MFPGEVFPMQYLEYWDSPQVWKENYIKYLFYTLTIKYTVSIVCRNKSQTAWNLEQIQNTIYCIKIIIIYNIIWWFF